MSTVRSARRQMRRAAQSFDAITHLSGRSILMLFSEIDHLTDGRELMDIGRQICAQGATPIMVGPLGDLKDQLADLHCVAIDVPFKKRGFFADRAIRKSLQSVISRSGVDMVHGVGPRAALFGAKLAEISGVPFAATLAHPLSDHFPKEAEAVVSAQRIFIANPEFTEEFLDMAPHAEERAQLATQGVDLDMYSPSAVRSAEVIEFVERLSIPHHKPVLLLRATHEGGHIQELLWDTLADMAPLEFYPIIELPRGANKLEDKISRSLAKRRLTHQVRILDAQEDTRPLYQIAEAVLVDSYFPNSFNRNIAEAGAFGKPVLAPLEEGVKAQVQHDVNGWIFTTQSHQTLKASIAKALTLTGDRRKTMQAASQLHVRTHYNAKATAVEVLAAYEALLAANQPFPGVEDMIDFDGDPLEVAAPDARGLSLIAEEKKRRRAMSLRERSPALRTALRDQDRADAQDRLENRRKRVEPVQAPTFQQPKPSVPAPHGQPFEKMPLAASTPARSKAAPTDVMPAPTSNFSLLELARKPGGPVLNRPKTQMRPAAQELQGEGGLADDRPAVDLGGPLGLALSKTKSEPQTPASTLR